MTDESVDAKTDDSTEVEEGGVVADEELRTVEEELVFVREQLLRTAAELHNYRRRTEQVRANEAAFAKAMTIEPFLGILDDLERSLEAASASPDAGSDTLADAASEVGPDAAPNTVREGVALVHRKFLDELQRMGVTQIPSVGEPFDESLHEALMQQPATEDVAPGTVLHEVQKGYRLGDRVLRHSKVIVAA